MATFDWGTLNQEVIAEFRAHGGRVARFGDLPVIILHTMGARSGRLLEVPLIAVRHDGEMLLFGTAAGATSHPSWYYNLLANPRIKVEFGVEVFTADVVQLPEANAQEVIAREAEHSAQLVEYLEAASPRKIPVFAVRRV